MSLATMLFNRPVSGVLPQMNTDSINIDKDDIYCKALEAFQRKKQRQRYSTTSSIFNLSHRVGTFVGMCASNFLFILGLSLVFKSMSLGFKLRHMS